jgi:hypothetical protein
VVGADSGTGLRDGVVVAGLYRVAAGWHVVRGVYLVIKLHIASDLSSPRQGPPVLPHEEHLQPSSPPAPPKASSPKTPETISSSSVDKVSSGTVFQSPMSKCRISLGHAVESNSTEPI